MTKVLILLFTLFSISSCVETVIATSIGTAALATQERSIINSKKDLIIKFDLSKKLRKHGLREKGNMISSSVNEGRVLLTGFAKDEDDIKKSFHLAWKVKNVKEVIDEVQIAEKLHIIKSLHQYHKDSLITGKVKSRLLFADDLSYFDYKVVTVNNIVYLLGIAKSNSDLNKITDIVAKTRGVNEVVSHIVLKDDQRRY